MQEVLKEMSKRIRDAMERPKGETKGEKKKEDNW